MAGSSRVGSSRSCQTAYDAQVTEGREGGGWGTVAATLVAPIAWGTTYITVTETLPAGRPLLVAAVRVVPAGLLLLLVGRVRSSWRPRGAQWGYTTALSLAYFGVFFPLLIVGVYRLPGGVAAAVSGAQPLMVAALGVVLVGVRPSRLDLAVGVVAAVGVALVVLQPNAGLDPIGVLAAVGANLSFAVGVVLTKMFPTPPNRLADTGWQMLISGFILVPLVLLVEGTPGTLTVINLLGFAYLTLIATGIAFVLWLNGVRRLPSAAPPLLGIAGPVTAAILGWVVLQQTLAPPQLLGLVLAFGAIAYGAVVPGRATRVTTPS